MTEPSFFSNPDHPDGDVDTDLDLTEDDFADNEVTPEDDELQDTGEQFEFDGNPEDVPLLDDKDDNDEEHS